MIWFQKKQRKNSPLIQGRKETLTEMNPHLTIKEPRT